MPKQIILDYRLGNKLHHDNLKQAAKRSGRGYSKFLREYHEAVGLGIVGDQAIIEHILNNPVGKQGVRRAKSIDIVGDNHG